MKAFNDFTKQETDSKAKIANLKKGLGDLKGEAKTKREKEIEDEEKVAGEVAGKLKTAKEAFEPLKDEWDKAEAKRMVDEAKEYKEQKDKDRQAAKEEFDKIKGEYNALVNDAKVWADRKKKAKTQTAWEEANVAFEEAKKV